MRAITVRQPWAWAIVHGGKDVENRSRNIAGAYRGPVAIHAGLTDAVIGRDIVDVMNAWRRWWAAAGMPGGQRGHVIGVVDIVDVHSDTADQFVWLRDAGAPRTCSRWAMPDHHHLVLANPRPLTEPIPATGRLGLWTLPDDLTAQIAEQIGADL